MYKTEFCEVKYLKKFNSVFCSWKKFCKGDDYKNPLLYGLNILNDEKCETWITDTTNGFENENDESEWLINNFIPQTIDSSCKLIVFILQRNSHLKEEIKGQAEALKKFFEVEICENLEIAKNLIKSRGE